MTDPEMNGKRIHFMGVGGIGMSALAELAHARGAAVSGCDRERNEQTARLGARGIAVFPGHDPAHCAGQDLLVYTSAVPADHPERLAAAETMRRGTFLASLLNASRALGVCGTHGKTTTTWMAAHLLIAGGLDPTVILGGVAPALNGNLRLGAGELFLAELDESDGSFTEPRLSVAAITNIESEHLHHYGSFERYREAFARYADNAGGTLIGNLDDAQTAALLRQHSGRTVTFGLDAAAELQARTLRPDGDGQRFDLFRHGDFVATAVLAFAGRHNVENALCALALAEAAGVPLEEGVAHLATCSPVERRMQLMGAVNGVPLYSDYAHHPTEIRAGIAATRAFAKGPVVVAFQPHLYSRTRDYADDFGAALALADRVLLVDLYPAREAPIPGVDAAMLVKKVRACGGEAEGPFTLAETGARLTDAAAEAGLAICMGAGDIHKVAQALAARPRTQESAGV